MTPLHATDADHALFARFPRSFTWGVSTSSFQIEGDVPGRGESIWDRFCRVPGAIADGSNADRACDHVRRLEEDLDHLAWLGVDAYRFSISWPRVQPAGEGAWHEAGLAFYERLVDGLRARGIAPHLTLNHWDLPQALQARGGWASRDTVPRFVDYARGVLRRLGDRVASVATHNEPWVMAVLGHERGEMAPGLRDRGVAMRVAHHLLLSHGLALQALRADGVRSPLGIVLNFAPIVPATPSAADREAARAEDEAWLRWYLEPVLLGAYPPDRLAALGADAPPVQPGDLATMAAPLDFLGINYYTRFVASAGAPYDARTSGLPLTEMGWEVVPASFTELLLRLHRDYRLPPVWIMENGAAFADAVAPDGSVPDPRRIDYFRSHLAALADARDAGVRVDGYMAWSLMDNFEWASGFAKRFGLFHVDYATCTRTPKASAHWWRAVLDGRR